MTTREEATQWTMRECEHFNGKEWFGYMMRCVQQPRVQRLDRYIRKDRSVISVWHVDGQPVADFEAALAGLANPPTISADEQAALDTLGPDFAEDRPSFGYEIGVSLRNKGLVEAERGRYRLRRVGGVS